MRFNLQTVHIRGDKIMYDDTYYKFALDIRQRTLSLGQDRLIKQPPPEPIEFDGIEEGEEPPPPEPIEFDDIEHGEDQPPPEPVEFDDIEQGEDWPPPEPIEFEE
jgi:hypothetical protein